MRRITSPSLKKPKKWRAEVCQTCYGVRRVINGAWLKHIRLTKNLSQRDVSRQLEISGPYLSDLERNRRETPEIIARAYQRLKGKTK